MQDIYLKASTREEMMTALKAANLVKVEQYQDENDVTQSFEVPQDCAIDHVGIIYDVAPPATEGGEPVFIAQDGYHVNVRLFGVLTDEIKTALGATLLDPAPASPRRVWA